MGNEKSYKKVNSTPKLARRRLSDITNFPPPAIWADSQNEPSWPDCLQKSNEIQHHKELEMLHKLIAEKEMLHTLIAQKDATIEAQAKQSQKLVEENQKLSMESRHLFARNEEIIQHYCALFKEVSQARDKLKLLQHEYSQMSTVYKIEKSELQMKLAEANEKLRILFQEKESRDAMRGYQASTEMKPSSQKVRRRHSNNHALEASRALFSSADRSYSQKSQQNSLSLGLKSLHKVEEEAAIPPPDAFHHHSKRSSSLHSRLSNTEQKQHQEFQKKMMNVTENSSDAPSGPLDTQSDRLSSSARPMRKAAISIASYKEPPLNTKMRRPG